MPDIRDNIQFLGNRDDMDRLYQAMDVFILPSRYEGLPVVAVEAQMSGVPMIISKNVSPEAVLADSTIVMDLSSGAKAWADAAGVTREKCTMTEEVRRMYDINIQAEKLTQYYEGLLAGNNRSMTDSAASKNRSGGVQLLTENRVNAPDIYVTTIPVLCAVSEKEAA